MTNRRNNMMGFNEYAWDDDWVINSVPMNNSRFRQSSYEGDLRNKRYSDAYGSYSGGYGPPGPPLGFRPEAETGPAFWGRPPPTSNIMGQGFGGPSPKRVTPEERSVKYLMRCGISKEILKSLPKDLLLLMDPEHCGICAYSFDSFHTSRVHYISKNHMKSQKRWLNQNAVGSLEKEVPMRSRDLYCELCDVHITSKMHANSHYSGKAHRAIVEGRKNPKNPMLLQKVNEDRLEQLIRREKKHLNNIQEIQKPQEQEEKKPFPPELYCDICKTTVTCTEQMTMHLNGKRHLTKEKQHILRVMKGEIPDQPDITGQLNPTPTCSKNKDGDADTCEAQDNDDDDVCEVVEAEPDDFDWGCGGGAWE